MQSINETINTTTIEQAVESVNKEATMTSAETRDISKMSAKELRAYVLELEAKVATKAKAKPRVQSSRKQWDIFVLLQEGAKSTAELAVAANTTKASVGSYLTYLRKCLVVIHKDGMGRHYLPEQTNYTADQAKALFGKNWVIEG